MSRYFKGTYKVFRSLLLSVILTVVGIYVLLYIAVSLPFVQNVIKERICQEVSSFLGGELKIKSLAVYPFNRVEMDSVTLYTPDGEECLTVQTLGAGIDLWALLNKNKIHITYGEILGMDAKVWQEEKDKPLNIQFIIDAMSPKDKTKPPTKFDLRLSSIIIRRSRASFDKRWMPENGDPEKMDFNHIKINDLQADITLPRLKNDYFDIDIRRVSLTEKSGLELEKLECKALITDRQLEIKGLEISLPNTQLAPTPLKITYDGLDKIGKALEDGPLSFEMYRGKVTPSDLKALFPPLGSLDYPFYLDLKLEGSLDKLHVDVLRITSSQAALDLYLEGEAGNLKNPKEISAELKKLDLFADFTKTDKFIAEVTKNQKISGILKSVGWVEMSSKVSFENGKSASFDGFIKTPDGKIDLYAEGKGSLEKKIGSAEIRLNTERLGFKEPLQQETGLQEAAINADISLTFAGGRDRLFSKIPAIDGRVDVEIPYLKYKGEEYVNFSVNAEKKGESIMGTANVESDPVTATILGNYTGQSISLDMDVDNFQPYIFGIVKNPETEFKGHLDANLFGESWGNLTGEILLENFVYKESAQKSLAMEKVELTSYTDEATNERTISLDSEFLKGKIRGEFDAYKIPPALFGIVYEVLPDWVPEGWKKYDFRAQDISLEYNFRLLDNNKLFRFFNVPVTLLTEIPIFGHIDTRKGDASLNLDVPYIQQGEKTLIHDTHLSATVNGEEKMANFGVFSTILGKNDDISLSLNVLGKDDKLATDISWDFNRKRAYKGKIEIDASTSSPLAGATNQKRYNLKFQPSSFQVNDTTWTIAAGDISYMDKMLEVKGVKAYHEQQFVHIDGKASSLPGDSITISLRDIDLDYIFETLNINYVTFGGNATGEIKATDVFTSHPYAFTDNLYITGFKYNGARLGEAKIKSRWLNDEKEVTLHADIAEKGERRCLVDGGIWVTRDSLSLDFEATKVNAAFMAPFFSAFASDISGRASGKIKLYGTFADINLMGKAKADSIGLRVNYTNVKYFGSDSVIMTPGRIYVPSFRIYDSEGHSGILTGQVLHNYFHEPRFEFVIKECDNLLCFDTDSRINPKWYGKIYGSGGGTIKGYPGYVGITVDMNTRPGSNFTFVLNETMEAADYQFLTFTDKKKEEAMALAAKLQEKDELSDYIKKFKKKKQEEAKVRESIFAMDLRGTITDELKLTLVMDPVAGDKISCTGAGAINIGYSSESDDFTMFGKYTIEEGVYNFTLQDLILKDFNIRQGSTISFNGDPFNAILNIDAIYKVNTNLADLDKSFSTDRDLNRTNVPVDAVLKVDGTLQSPDISFDIELPTLTSDVARKVKSIISTDDMMSMQIIYLLALGRFYAPEYMSGTENGGEFTAIASTTLSSQLSNILSQINNNLSVTPSFRSDKGDFSDFEFDLGLSTRFFNNRLLINGNFGYRDKNTSSTTFIGDFDLEYLLNRSGRLRLKAYNHFNDQNYYLKSALTTQGIGIMLKHDFDSLFDFIKKKPKEATDSVQK